MELVVVIFLISILALSIDLQLPQNTIELRAQAEGIASSIRYVQALSMTRGERFRITFASTNYVMANSAGTSIAHPATNATTTSLESYITLSVNAALPSSLLAFDGRGIPHTNTSTPGTALSSTGTITLTAGTDTQTIQISPETGRVTIQ